MKFLYEEYDNALLSLENAKKKNVFSNKASREPPDKLQLYILKMVWFARFGAIWRDILMFRFLGKILHAN